MLMPLHPRWLKPSNLNDLATVQGLIESAINQIYPKLDLFAEDAVFLLYKWLGLIVVGNGSSQVTPPPTPIISSSIEALEVWLNNMEKLMPPPTASLPPGVSKEESTQYRNLIEDIRYVIEMKKMEVEAEQKLSAVSLSLTKKTSIPFYFFLLTLRLDLFQ